MPSELAVGTLAGYLRFDVTPAQQSLTEFARTTLPQFAATMTQAAVRAGNQSGTGLSQGLAGSIDMRVAQQQVQRGLQQASQDATRTGAQAGTGLSQGLANSIDMRVTQQQVQRGLQQTGQQAGQAGQQAGSALSSGLAASTSTQGAQAALRLGFSGAAAPAAQAGEQAGAALSLGLAGAINTQGAHGARQAVQHGLEGTVGDAGQAGADAGAEYGKQFGSMAGKAIAALGITAVLHKAMEAQSANSLISAQLDLTTQEAKRAGELAGKLYTKGLADNLDDANDLLRNVASTIGGSFSALSDQQLTTYSGYTRALAQMTGEEAEKITQLVSRLLSTGLASSADQAFDIITRASQRTTAGMQGDLIDVGTEYANVFKQLGLNGSQALAMIAAASKDGSIQMDKIGDSLKEFTIRAVDLSSASQAVADLGLDYQRLAADIASGGDKADAAFRQVVTGLLGIKDPAKQANDAIQFFGSPLEDLGTAKVPEFLRQLNAAGKGLGDFSGAATDAADKVNTGASTSLSNFGRQLEQVGTRVGTGLLPVLEPALDGLDHLGSAVGVVADGFGEMPRPVQLTALGIGVLGAALTRNMRTIDSSITGLARWKTGLTSLGKQLGVGGLIALGVTAITDRMERAHEIQESINGSTKTWTDRLVEANGKWDNILRAQQAMDVMQSKQFQDLQARGIKSSDIIAAAQGDVAKANQIYAQLNKAKQNWFTSIFSSAAASGADSHVVDLQNWVMGLNQANYAAERNAQAVGVMNDAMKSAGSIATGVATTVGQLAPQKSLTDKLFGPMQITAGIMSKSLATLSTKPLDRMALSLGTVQKNASEADTRLQYFSMTVDQLSGVTIDSDRITRMMNQAVRDLKDGFKAATDATDGNIESLIGVNGQIDTTTKAGADLFDTVSDYREAYDKATSSAYSNAVASGNQAGALKLAQKAGQDAYDQWMADAKALGINEGKAKDMATAAGILEAQKITDKNFAITAADRATGVLETVKKTLGSLPALTTLRVNVVAAGMDAAKAAVGAATSWITGKHALGGLIYGPGTGTSDSIPAWLSNGEYVVRASAARKHRGMLDAINYGAPGFADGGSVNIDLLGSGNASGATGPALASIAAMRSNVSQANATITAAAAAARAAAAVIGVGGSGVTRWAGVMTQALRMTGQYTPANLAAGLHQMQTESGGNPYAINNYDINAQRGDPSRGLMQTIMATFKSFAMPGYSGNIYDPLSNILASIRYTLARYGSLQNGWRGVAYAGGGLVQGPGSSTSDSIAAYLSNREFVVNAAATARHLPVLQAINSGATAASMVPDVNLNVTVKIGERDITNIVDVQVDRGIQHFAQQLGHEVRLAKAQH